MEPCVYAEDIGTLKADVKNLVGWQGSQNGSIHRVEDKIDKLIFWGLTFCAANLIALVFLIIKGVC